MTLEQLRIFVAVAEREHMTRAADSLGLVQSAVSSAVAALENRYQTPLFHRVGRGIRLTEAGRLFMIEARAVLARAEAAETALAELGGLKRGRLAIHASQTIASYWLPQRLVRFHRTYPDIEIALAIGNTAQVAAAVVEGAAELGFIEGTVDEPLLSEEEIGGDRLVLVAGTAGGFAHPDGEAGRAALMDLDWVLREPGSGTRSEFAAALRGFGLDPAVLRVALQLPSNEAVRAAVEAGAGVSALSELVAAAGLRAGTLRRFGVELPWRPFHALRHRQRYRSKAADALLSIVGSGDDGGLTATSSSSCNC